MNEYEKTLCDRTNLALLRFDQAKWLKDICDTEKLRFTPIKNWTKLENDNARGDRWEGASQIQQPEVIKSLKLKFSACPELGYVEHKPTAPIVFRDNKGSEFSATHAICFSMLGYKNFQGKSSHDFSEFGNSLGASVLVLKDIPALSKMLGEALGKLAPDCKHWGEGPVSYVDEKTYSGDYSVFLKPNRFAWQREFRFTIYYPDKENEYISVHLPGLAKIADFIVNPDLNFEFNNEGHRVEVQIKEKAKHAIRVQAWRLVRGLFAFGAGCWLSGRRFFRNGGPSLNG